MNTIIKTYKKSLNGKMKMKIDKTLMSRKGYVEVEREEIKQFNGGKGCLLFLLFPPLVLLGRSKYIKIKYQKYEKI